MDHRENANNASGFMKDLESGGEDFNDMITENGKTFRVPYRMVKEVIFKNLRKEELKDMEHSARLQYRLLLMDPILKAKVEFNKQRIVIVYNPVGADNRKEKISERELMEFLAKEGIKVDRSSVDERDVDYYNEIYRYQFDPVSIREHPPYSYTREQWREMKPAWEKMRDEAEAVKKEKFREWQRSFLDAHPELAKEYNHVPQKKKPTLMERIFGKKKDEKEKGFWFHGA
ncbi:MAG: hypothetical protein KGI00_00105 [Candidatus Micrarchaeota archaeon]|nr:hypothetical protein [Candidatus Micrarchaeota archaeon]MDE1849119.1 hypothetical protein [Candidatus Micrarchaeota archaeon]